MVAGNLHRTSGRTTTACSCPLSHLSLPPLGITPHPSIQEIEAIGSVCWRLAGLHSYFQACHIYNKEKSDFIIILLFFSYHTFWSYFSLPEFLPEILQSPYPASFMLIFSYLSKNIHKNKNKQAKYHYQNKAKGNKKFTKILSFVFVNCSWVWGLPWSVVHMPSETRLEKIDFLPASGYQLQMASWLGVEPHVHFSLLVF